jgi:WD40 repeat protein
MAVFHSINGHEHTVSYVQLTSDGIFLYSVSMDHMIKYWDINSGNNKNSLKGNEE